MSRRLVLFALGLYPADWRDRYSAEVVALIDDEGLTWRMFPNLMRGAAAEWTALASSPDRRRVWLGRPAGRRLFASAAVLAPIAVMVMSAYVAEVLALLLPDDSWVILAAAGSTVFMLPVAMWRFQFAELAKRWLRGEQTKDIARRPAAPVGVELRFWVAILLAMQLATHFMIAQSVQTLPWPPEWIRAATVLGYFTLPTSFLLTLSMQSAARRYERVTGAPLHQPKRKPSVPSNPLGL